MPVGMTLVSKAARYYPNTYLIFQLVTEDRPTFDMIAGSYVLTITH